MDRSGCWFGKEGEGWGSKGEMDIRVEIELLISMSSSVLPSFRTALSPLIENNMEAKTPKKIILVFKFYLKLFIYKSTKKKYSLEQSLPSLRLF